MSMDISVSIMTNYGYGQDKSSTIPGGHTDMSLQHHTKISYKPHSVFGPVTTRGIFIKSEVATVQLTTNSSKC